MSVHDKSSIAPTHQAVWTALLLVMLHRSPDKDRTESLGWDMNVSRAYGRAVNVLNRRDTDYKRHSEQMQKAEHCQITTRLTRKFVQYKS